MMEKLPRVTASEVIRALERAGFFLARQSGSHKIYKNAERAKVGCFITCDDAIIERYKGKAMKVVNPIDFVMEGGQ